MSVLGARIGSNRGAFMGSQLGAFGGGVPSGCLAITYARYDYEQPNKLGALVGAAEIPADGTFDVPIEDYLLPDYVLPPDQEIGLRGVLCSASWDGSAAFAGGSGYKIARFDQQRNQLWITDDYPEGWRPVTTTTGLANFPIGRATVMTCPYNIVYYEGSSSPVANNQRSLFRYNELGGFLGADEPPFAIRTLNNRLAQSYVDPNVSPWGRIVTTQHGGNNDQKGYWVVILGRNGAGDNFYSGWQRVASGSSQSLGPISYHYELDQPNNTFYRCGVEVNPTVPGPHNCGRLSAWSMSYLAPNPPATTYGVNLTVTDTYDDLINDAACIPYMSKRWDDADSGTRYLYVYAIKVVVDAEFVPPGDLQYTQYDVHQRLYRIDLDARQLVATIERTAGAPVSLSPNSNLTPHPLDIDSTGRVYWATFDSTLNEREAKTPNGNTGVFAPRVKVECLSSDLQTTHWSMRGATDEWSRVFSLAVSL
ncbi:MAG: hypothetical protein AAGG38_13500 [Planctomycetota bacterium]